MIRLFPFHPDDFARRWSQQVSNHTHEISLIWDYHPDNGQTARLTGIGNPLDLTLKFDQHAATLLPAGLSEVQYIGFYEELHQALV